MVKCWKNDPDATPTFTELKNRLKDIEPSHEVRIVNNMKVSFYVRVTDLGSAFLFHFDGFDSNCYVTKTSASQTNGEDWAN